MNLRGSALQDGAADRTGGPIVTLVVTRSDAAAHEAPEQRRARRPVGGPPATSVRPSALPVAATEAVAAVGSPPSDAVSPDVARMLRVLRTPAMWVDSQDAVLWAHPGLVSMRVVRRRSVRVAEIAEMIRAVRSSGQNAQQDMSIRRPGRRQADFRLRVRAAPMVAGACLVMVEDISEAERLDHVRRDFVANVSHELKTPVGALSLLAEAVVEARNDQEAVARFGQRMVAEARRLTSLVNDLMDLSRLEGIDPLHPLVPVSVDEVVEQAVDDAGSSAQDKGIQFLRGGVAGLTVLGVQPELVTAVRNLIVNAISYSAPGTKVAVTTGRSDGAVTIAVTDQGIGIPAAELDRIFERFYRVDPARSRGTGGTGLGLAIVKHVCANHGGSCEVWSRPGEGSTFTIRLPEHSEPAGRSRSGPGPDKEGT